MSFFGSQPPRALESFGVVGILGENCKVYYDTIFTSRHVGRVTDLLSAQLKNLGPDELRLRIILTFSLYEAYRFQLEALSKKDGEPLPEPLVIECGVDDEKVAIGVALTYSEAFPVDVELAKKISAGTASTRLERFIAQMMADTNQVIVRIQPSTRRVEVVSLLAIPGKVAVPAERSREPEVIVLKPDSKVSGLKAEYHELGDLDYKKLLSEDGLGARSMRMATGEILAAGALEADIKTKVQGRAPEKETVTRISGATEHVEQEDLTVLEGGSDGSERELVKAKKRLGLYQNRIVQLQSKIANLESASQTEAFVVKGSEPEVSSNEELQIKHLGIGSGDEPGSDSTQENGPGFGSSVKKLIKTIFGKSKKTELDEAGVFSEPPPDLESPNAGNKQFEVDGADPITEKLLREQVERLEATISRMRTEAQSLKGDSGNTRAQKWADGIAGELLAEKARINEMAKKLNLSARQKEFEFKSRETRLTEELRRKEEQLRQKSFALDRAKEQVSQLTVAAERSKSSHSGASEEGRLSQKLSFTQKLLQGAKDENYALVKRVEELKDQLMAAQSSSSSKTRSTAEFDLSAMKTKYERVQKQNEEFKRANQLLMERLNEIQKPRPGSMSNDELKSKFETAMRLAATYQKDSEQLRLKVEELQKEEARLKAEVNRATNALRSAKKSSSGGGQAA